MSLCPTLLGGVSEASVAQQAWQNKFHRDINNFNKKFKSPAVGMLDDFNDIETIVCADFYLPAFLAFMKVIESALLSSSDKDRDRRVVALCSIRSRVRTYYAATSVGKNRADRVEGCVIV
jgi:hypothetical protein